MPRSAPTPNAAKTAAAAVPDTAGMTSAFAAATPQRTAAQTDVFHSLFSDPGRSTPVAAVVSQLWGVSGASPAASAATLGDLFKDDGRLQLDRVSRDHEKHQETRPHLW